MFSTLFHPLLLTSRSTALAPSRRRAPLLLALLVLLMAPPAPVLGQAAELRGTFHVVWGDAPSDAQARTAVRFFLVDAAGTMTELLLDEELLRPLGGALAVDRKPVTVSGTEAAGARPDPAGRSDPAVRVSGIRRAGGGAAVSADVSGAPRSGTHRYVTILCKFADAPDVEPETKATYQSWLTGGYPSLDHYWREVSEGRLDLSGSIVVGWYTLPQPRSYYLTASGRANLALLADDCTAAADADVSFPDFYGVNLQLNGELDGSSYGGSRSFTYDGQQKTYGATWLAGWAGQSTYAHHTGHSLGLPHSSGPYAATYDSRWDVMSNADVNHVPALDTYVAQHTIAYHKDLLGWVPDSRKLVVSGQMTETIALQRGALPGAEDYLLVQIPLEGPARQFYTVEARARAGYDSALPGDAVVIHRVSPILSDRVARVVDADGNGDPNDEGAMWRPGETFREQSGGVGIAVTVNSATDTGFSVTVSQVVLEVTSSTQRPDAVAGSPYADTLAATGGDGAYQWAVESGSLPPGLSLDAAAGRVSGIPTTAGDFFFYLQVTSAGARVVRFFQLTVLPRLEIGSDPVRPEGAPGAPYSDQLQAAGGNGSYAWTLAGGALPPGLSLGADGRVAGTPERAGTYGYTARVASAGAAATRSFVLAVADSLTIVSEAVRPEATVGAPYTDRLLAAGGSGYAWSLAGGALPPGLSLGAGGVVAGTPLGGGSYSYTARVTSGARSLTRAFSVQVREGMGIVSDSLRPPGTTGVPYADQLEAAGGAGAYAWSVTGGALPPGLALDAATGAIAGTPTVAGHFRFTVTAASGGLSHSRVFGMAVYTPLRVDSDSVRPHGLVGTPHNDLLQATGGPGGYSWRLAEGELPPGLALSPAGPVTGTPTRAGTWRPVVAVQSAGVEVRKTLVMVVHTPLVVHSAATRASAVMAAPYADTLRAEGGPGPIAWTLFGGSLPEGVKLDSAGVLSGVPLAVGSYPVTLRVTSGPLSQTRGFVVVVSPPALQVDAVVEQLLGSGRLTAEEVRYLDLQGNRNGRLDVGDVRAWLRRNNLAAPALLPPG